MHGKLAVTAAIVAIIAFQVSDGIGWGIFWMLVSAAFVFTEENGHDH